MKTKNSDSIDWGGDNNTNAVQQGHSAAFVDLNEKPKTGSSRLN